MVAIYILAGIGAVTIIGGSMLIWFFWGLSKELDWMNEE